VGDYIVEVDGHPVWDMDEATDALTMAPEVFSVTVMSLNPEVEEVVEEEDGSENGYGSDPSSTAESSNAPSPERYSPHEVHWDEFGILVADGDDEVVAAFAALKEAAQDVPAVNNTPLHLASFMGMPAIVRLLVAEGADMTAKNDDDATAADIACQHADADGRNLAEILSILKAQGRVEALMTGSGVTPERVEEWSVSEVLAWANKQGERSGLFGVLGYNVCPR
jgi:hypothetical protein